MDRCIRTPWECPTWALISRFAKARALELFPTSVANDGLGDAFRHCLWQCLLTRNLGAQSASEWGAAHESGENSNASRMDLHNNLVGRAIGTSLRPRWGGRYKGFLVAEAAEQGCMSALKNGRLWILNASGQIVRSATWRKGHD